jgi:cytoskeletal protein CcmA (bactofilin family)
VASDTGLSNEMTVIGQGTTIRGEVDFDQGARILGVFEGKIRSKGEVHIAESADCRAEIDAENIVIDGKTNGNIIARNRCRLSEHANLTGDITAKTLLVEEGATFVGHCSVGENASAASRPNTTTASTSTGTASSASSSAQNVSTRVDFKPPWKTGGETAESSTEDALADANRAAASGAA